MSFLQTQYWFLLLFALLPILLHLFKKRKAKKISISSLYLLNRKSRTLNRRIRLHQILLLLSRCFLVLAIGFYFLIPIFHQAPESLARLLPLREPSLILLDTRWDSANSLRAEFLSLYPGMNSKDLQFVELNFEDTQTLEKAVMESITGSHSRVFLFSRFYGAEKEEVQNLRDLNIELIPTGPLEISNTALTRVAFTPSRPLLGERIDISGMVETIDKSQKEIDLTLLRPGKSEQHRRLVFSDQSQASFSFTLTADQAPSESIEVRHSLKDSIPDDDSASFEIPIQAKFRIAMVDDLAPPDSRRSRLYYLHKFFQGLSLSYPQTNFEISTYQSSGFQQHSTGVYDWILIGDWNSEFLPEDRGNILLFWQKSKRMQRFFDERIGIKSFAIESTQKDVSLLTIPSADQALFTGSWKAMRYLQIKSGEGKSLLSAGKDPLLIEKGNLYFSAIDFSEYDFSGVFDPYFPIYLFRLFLDRWEEADHQFEKKIPLTKRIGGINTTQPSKMKSQSTADLSVPILLLCLGLCLLELYLILKLERAVSERGGL